MEWLASHGDTVFLGQAVEVPGTAMFNTLTQVPVAQKLELPVAEEMQMGMAIGFSFCFSCGGSGGPGCSA